MNSARITKATEALSKEMPIKGYLPAGRLAVYLYSCPGSVVYLEIGGIPGEFRNSTSHFFRRVLGYHINKQPSTL